MLSRLLLTASACLLSAGLVLSSCQSEPETTDSTATTTTAATTTALAVTATTSAQTSTTLDTADELAELAELIEETEEIHLFFRINAIDTCVPLSLWDPGNETELEQVPQNPYFQHCASRLLEATQVETDWEAIWPELVASYQTDNYDKLFSLLG